ncbi:MAG: putative Curli production assembly/transport component CsgG precursor [Caulobacter sp.]|nr:putative Curli production assembly/transport component CsgG precursor [Caulobacter sp.]
MALKALLRGCMAASIFLSAPLWLMATGQALAAQAVPPPAFTGLKKTVAVDLFGGAELTAGQVASDGMTAMLTDVLINDGRFVVVERQSLTSIQTEQQLGQTGATTAETAAQSNRLIGARFIVKGAITKYNPSAGGGGVNVGGFGGGLLGAGASSKTATVTISLRLIDTTTGQVVSTFNGTGSASSQRADAGLVNSKGGTLGLNGFRETSLGKALEDAIKKAVAKIGLDVGKIPWTGLVVDNRGGQIYLNAGADQNVQPGMAFAVFRQGETITDPGTGAVLDTSFERVGTVRVDSVREKISIGQMVDGQPPMRGDLLKAQ